jgi:type I restriction enzyme, S subunit
MSWHTARLSDVVNFVGGGTPSKNRPDFWNGNIPWVSPKDMWQREINDTEDHITHDAVLNSATQVIPPGTVIVVVRSGILVRRFPVAVTRVPVAINQDLKALISRGPLVPEFLALCLEAFSEAILANYVKRGATVHSIDVQRFQSLSVPVPSTSEQQKIVELLKDYESLRQSRALSDRLLGRLAAAVFHGSFGDPTRNPRGLVKKPLGELIQLKSGDFLPSKDMSPEGQFPVYGGNGIAGYHSEFMFPNRMIVLGRVGAYCGVVHYSEPNCWITDNALYVSKMSSELDPVYLTAALRLADLNQYAGRAGQPLISAGRIYPIEILVPPLLKQERFAQYLESVELLRSDAAAAGQKLEHLSRILLQRAFSGELTSIWRNANQSHQLAGGRQQETLEREIEP